MDNRSNTNRGRPFNFQKHMPHSKRDELRIKSIFQDRPLIGPRAVNIHITNVCNLQCLFCWDRSPLVRPTAKKKIYLELNILKGLISDCARVGVETICLEGGEVMLYPRIKELFRFIKLYGLNLEIYSNCAFAPSLFSSFFYVDKVRVNLSAISADSYKRIHGAKDLNVFPRVQDNLYRLSEMKKNFHRLQIQLIFIVNELNFGEVADMARLAEKVGADELVFKLVEATAATQHLILSDSSVEALKGFLREIKSRCWKAKNNAQEIYRIICSKDFKKDCYAISRTAWHNDRYFYFKASAGKKIRCLVGWFYGFVDLKGRVVGPCDNVGVAILGNIHTASFAKIWFSPRYQRLRKKAFRGVDPRMRRWQECRYCGFVKFNRQMAQKTTS